MKITEIGRAFQKERKVMMEMYRAAVEKIDALIAEREGLKQQLAQTQRELACQKVACSTCEQEMKIKEGLYVCNEC